MGNICNCSEKDKKKIVLLMVGLDNAGKTVIAKQLAGDTVDSSVPTVGFSVIYLKYKKYFIEIFDLGGGPSIRSIWERYFVDAHGIIFVVDSSDNQRFDEVKDILKNMLSHEKICQKPVLLLANKQDSENALDEAEVIELLDLEKIVNYNECPTLVKSCSAIRNKCNSNIKEGYEWIVNYIIRNYNTLNKRVKKDSEEQKTNDEIKRQNIIETLRKQLLTSINEDNDNDDNIIETYSTFHNKQCNFFNINNDKNSDSSESSDEIEKECPQRPKSANDYVTKEIKKSHTMKYFTRKNFNKRIRINPSKILLGDKQTKSSIKKIHYRKKNPFIRSKSANGFCREPIENKKNHSAHYTTDVINLQKKCEYVDSVNVIYKKNFTDNHKDITIVDMH